MSISSSVPRRPGIGVGAIVRRGNRVLLGHRRSRSHGDSVWQFPGGHLEWGESVYDCARREVLEETGLDVVCHTAGPWTNDVFEREGKHYVTLFVIGDSATGDPQVLEPENCERWGWFSWDALPEPLFLPVQHLVEAGYRPPGL